MRYKHAFRAGPEQAGAAAWCNLAFSFAGLRALAPDAAELGPGAFAEGMRARGGLLGDRHGEGAREEEPHLLLLAASDEPKALDHLLAELTHGATGLRARWRERGIDPGAASGEAALIGHEHFGFEDGVSQPAVRGLVDGRLVVPRTVEADDDPNATEYARPGEALVWPGEFVLGYPRQSPRHARLPLPPDRCAPWWTRNGSFLVYRKLRQDVLAFRKFAAAQAARLKLDAEQVQAMMVGRWPDGSSLETHPHAPGGAPDNGFGYGGDPAGARCPIAAHARQVNPRDATSESGGPTVTLTHRLLRRGIPYGAPLAPGAAHDDGTHRGLLFLCYQASIERQFEFLMANWLNDPHRPAGPCGVDLLVGQVAGGPRRGRIGRAEVETGERFVIPEGGGYFFSPSLSAIRDVLAR
jgi:deferrochelatase/peroxidase EfeB